MPHFDPDSALARLHPGQVCGLILSTGQERKGAWNPNLPGFDFCDGKNDGPVFLPDVDEWWPTSIPFR